MVYNLTNIYLLTSIMFIFQLYIITVTSISFNFDWLATTNCCMEALFVNLCNDTYTNMLFPNQQQLVPIQSLPLLSPSSSEIYIAEVATGLSNILRVTFRMPGWNQILFKISCVRFNALFNFKSCLCVGFHICTTNVSFYAWRVL